jgi:hypothetical protein
VGDPVKRTHAVRQEVQTMNMKKLVWGFAAAVPLLTSPAWADHEKNEKNHRHESVKMADLPAPVQETFRREAAGGEIEEVRKETRKSGEVIYEAEIVKAGKGTDLEVNAAGTVVERGKPHDESKEREKGEKHEKHEK